MLPIAGLILAGAIGTTYAADAQVLYVDADATRPTHDGSTCCFAYTELYEALAVAHQGQAILHSRCHPRSVTRASYLLPFLS